MGSIWSLHDLVPHADFPPANVEGVTGQLLGFDEESLFVEFGVKHAGSLVIPEPAPSSRTDGLWRTTCFEVFLGIAGSAQYCELNFSPSEAWAAYTFDSYRQGNRALSVRLDPEILTYTHLPYFHLSAEFDVLPSVSTPTVVGLSAVIEETDGTKSYWALTHPRDVPDFHHPDSFVLELPAID